MEDNSKTESLAAEFVREQRGWRTRMLNGFCLSAFVLAAFATAWNGLVTRLGWPVVPALLATTALIGTVTFVRTLPYALRAGVLLGALQIACSVVLAFVGFAPNAMVGFGLVVVGSTLLLGRNAGIFSAVLGTLSIALLSLSQRSGVLERLPGWREILDSADFGNGVRVSFTFGLAAMTSVVGISYLFGRMQRLLGEKASALERLREEQAENERIARDLALREGAFRKGRELEILGRLAGSMAHDFNNSLLVIWAALDELALSDTLPEPARSAVSAIRVAADQATATTRQLRAFGPMAPPRPTELLLSPVLAKAKTMLARVLPRNIELALDIREDAAVRADEGEMLRVLTNLALNARDAMREGGRLTLRVREVTSGETSLETPPEAFVAIEVEDNGTGMSAEVRDRLFEPFFTTKGQSGTGLGLSSVRELVEGQGGRVAVTSELGRGTTLSLFWPRLERGLEQAAPPKTAPRERPAVVLLVEDEPVVRKAIRRNLARAGMTVLEASDGAEGLAEARRYGGHIDVLCTDCVMQGIPVRQLITSFRELHRGRVLVCSGYASDETGLSADLFDDFLAKPFTGQDLVARILVLTG